MRRFRFDEAHDRDAIAAELARLLGRLGIDLTVDQAIHQLRGWIAEHACVRGQAAEPGDAAGRS